MHLLRGEGEERGVESVPLPLHLRHLHKHHADRADVSKAPVPI